MARPPKASHTCTSGDTNRHVVLYDYKPSRKHENPKIFLENFKGYLHADSYNAYHCLPKVWLLAHVRRRFADIFKSLPDYNYPDSHAAHGMEFCERLFVLERKFADLAPGDKYGARLKQSKPAMDEVFAWAGSCCAAKNDDWQGDKLRAWRTPLAGTRAIGRTFGTVAVPNAASTPLSLVAKTGCSAARQKVLRNRQGKHGLKPYDSC